MVKFGDCISFLFLNVNFEDSFSFVFEVVIYFIYDIMCGELIVLFL